MENMVNEIKFSGKECYPYTQVKHQDFFSKPLTMRLLDILYDFWLQNQAIFSLSPIACRHLAIDSVMRKINDFRVGKGGKKIWRRPISIILRMIFPRL